MVKPIVRSILPTVALVSVLVLPAATQDLARDVDTRTTAVMSKVVTWRRDIHQHPELSNRETRTAKVVADHLRALGLEVQTGVAKTGVVGLLRGGKPGKVVALRADMDALPVTEMVDLPFKSVARSTVQRAGGRRDARVRARHARRDAAWASPRCWPA